MAYNPHSYFSFASQEPDSPEGYTITRASFSANFSPSSQSECPDSPDIPQLALPPSVVVNFPSPSASPGPHALDDEGYGQPHRRSNSPGFRRRSSTTIPPDWAAALGAMRKKRKRHVGRRALAAGVVAATSAALLLWRYGIASQ